MKLRVGRDPSRGMVLLMMSLRKSKRKCLATADRGVDFRKTHLFPFL